MGTKTPEGEGPAEKELREGEKPGWTAEGWTPTTEDLRAPCEGRGYGEGASGARLGSSTWSRISGCSIPARLLPLPSNTGEPFLLTGALL